MSRKRALYLLKRCVALSEDEALEFPSSSVSSEGKMLIHVTDIQSDKLDYNITHMKTCSSLYRIILKSLKLYR